jgi:hypothetical protein
MTHRETELKVAKRIIRNIRFSRPGISGRNCEAMRDRAIYLLNKPDHLSQDSFGICTFTVATYGLLLFHPIGFAELVRAFFDDGFAFVDLGRLPDSEHEERWDQFSRNGDRKRYRLDFFAARSLAFYLSAMEPEYYQVLRTACEAKGE